MRYLVRVKELEGKIDYLSKQLDIIDENIVKLEKEKELLNWKGVACESFLKKYDRNIVKLKKIQQSTVTCIEFLIKYYDRYGEVYKKFKAKYANILNVEVENGLS